VENGRARPYSSLDCINIEKQLGFTYGPGSLEDVPAAALACFMHERAHSLV
jgi:tyrosinase